MPYLDRESIQFHYELSGAGPTVVFCHGLTGELDDCKQLLGSLAGYRLLVWDARGHGKTRPVGSAESFTFDVFARDLAALMDHLQIEDAVVGGISMGAAVSVRFAVRYPCRVRGLVLVRPAWLERPSPEGLRIHPVVADYLGRYGAELGWQLFEKSAECQELRERFPAVTATLRDQFFVDDAVERRWRLVGIPNDAPVRNWEEVEALRMPSLVVGNESDPVHPFSYALTWTKHLPHGRLVQVPSKSLDLDQHVRSVRAHLAAMLASLPPSSETGPSPGHVRFKIESS